MTTDQYHEQVLSTLDTMSHESKDAIIRGFLNELYPWGDPDHPVNGADFIAEAIRLLAEFHPNHLLRRKETDGLDDPTVPEL